MQSDETNRFGARHGRGRNRAAVALVAALALGGLTACGDDEPSAQETYCAAGDELRTSLDELVSLDLIADGKNALDEAVDGVTTAADDLRESASDAASEEVDALEAALQSMSDAITDLGDELSVDNTTAIGTAIGEVATAAQAVFETLTDCE
jgi:hypothetical protein